VKRVITLVGVLGAITSAHAYIRSTATFRDGTTVAVYRTDNNAIQFYANSGIVPNLQSSASGSPVTVISPGSNPIAAIRSALATWNSVGTANLSFLPLQTTGKLVDPLDNQMTIVVGSTADDVSAVGGALAITAVHTASFTVGSNTTGAIADTDIILNPGVRFSTDGSTATDLQSVMTHELGHALGMNHSGVLGATMFQFAAPSQRFLSPDEVAFATAIYPRTGAVLGTISGRVVAADGSPIQSGLVTMMDTNAGSAITALTGADGTYSTQAMPGTYIVYVEPLGAGNIVQAGNLYLTTVTKVTANFQVSMLGGFDSPAPVVVTAGGTASVPDLKVAAGTSAMTFPFIGNGTGGGLNVGTSASLVATGQTVDLFLIGGGIDGSVAVKALGKGITVQKVAVDPNVRFGGSLAGQPFVRVTVNLAAQAVPSLASLILTKGQDAFAITGAFVLTPPTPTFTAAAVVNAASYTGAGVVSAGGISSIYDTTNNSLGPNPFVQNTAYDAYGNLPTTAGGVTVTFDGVPAPIYLAYAGQLNVQVPFEVAGKTSTKVVVNYYGSQSAPVTVAVAAAQPSFFTFTPQGKDAIIQNFPDFTLNSSTNPIARGGVAILYGTGIGQLPYTLGTGEAGVVPPPSYASKYSCSFGGKTSNAYGYWNYGFVGEATWTVGVPSDAPAGAVALTCTDSVSGATTQQGTIYVK